MRIGGAVGRVWCVVVAGMLGCAGGGVVATDAGPTQREGDGGDTGQGSGDGGGADVGEGDASGGDAQVISPADAAAAGSGGRGEAGSGGSVVDGSSGTGGECSAPACADAGSPTCESEAVAAAFDVVAGGGRVLFVYDRSGSMAQTWAGGTRWELAGAAVEAALTPLAGSLEAAAVFFPSSDPNAPAVCIDPTGVACILNPALFTATGTCGVNAVTQPDQIPFTTGTAFLEAFVSSSASSTAPLYAPIPGGLTPFKEALIEADATLAAAASAAGASVIVITDGDPNCEWDAAVAAQLVGDWRGAGISTHLIVLPGTTGASPLPALATTAATTLRTPVDEVELEQQLGEILAGSGGSALGSCEVPFAEPLDSADDLQLIVRRSDGRFVVPHDLAGGGYSVSGDRSQAVLEGATCSAAQAGDFLSLRFERGCVDLPVLPDP